MTAPETRCVLANACANPSQQVRERGCRDAAAAPSCTPQSLSESGGVLETGAFCTKKLPERQRLSSQHNPKGRV